MGKQTNKSGSHFGGEWTKQKLHIIEEYLKAYSTVLKNQKVKRIYVDGFAGSGITELKTEDQGFASSFIDSDPTVIEGSAILSLKYDFDEYYFLEWDSERISSLKEKIKQEYPQKYEKVTFINGDSNETLPNVLAGITNYDRCLMFLDPYALELKWETLEAISKCGVIDLWYLFPLSVIRLIEKNGQISESNKQIVSSILGTDEWFEKLFVESSEFDLFGEVHYDYNRIDYTEILEYIKGRFSSIFPYVSPESKLLKNKAKNAPMFLLCFMMTNKSEKAQSLADKLVKGIMNRTEKIK